MPEVEVFGYEVGDILAAAHLLVDGAADAVGVEAGPFVDLVAEVTEHLEVRDGGKAALEGVVEVVQEDDEGVQVEFLLGEVDGQAEVLGLDDEVAQADEGVLGEVNDGLGAVFVVLGLLEKFGDEGVLVYPGYGVVQVEQAQAHGVNGLHAALDGAVELEEDILEVPDIDTGEGVLGAASFHSGFGGLMFNGLVHTGKENAPRRTANILFLPANCHSYIVTYRIETVNLTKPAGNILVNPAQDSCHFLMDFLHAVQIPADGLIMKYPVAESTECIQRSRDILPLTVLLGHERKRPAQVFPQQALIFAVQQGDPKSKCQFCNNLRWSDAFMPSRYLFARLCNIVVQPCQTGSGREYSIPVLPACHGLQFPAQSIAQCYLKHRKTCVERLCQFKVTSVMKYRTGLIVRIQVEISLHSLGRENFFEERFVVFHIFCTFASQSRAFLSQLSVTGDESGFFYVLLQR